MAGEQFPVFDLGKFEQADAAERERLGAEVDAICRSTGFLAIANHGVPQAVIDGVWNKAHDFFDLAPEEKQRHARPTRATPMAISGPNWKPWRSRATWIAHPTSRKVSTAARSSHRPG
ncbi:2-oxoglutarate and iron-dependent oxygenase domain-containing protein [Pseudaminobacter salicylatoxidans]|uniref:2-oxoglutarate and iron-dependent oxygenase domain-containing protein n=1 Tax=Pseudaminobacter salicylatoxidans TaxID=93369 RepID=UPI001FCB1F3A|nr:2-oxoglutarate and iron-dependent oxygenase domain-containing protein [Pseudaminobacter salicylatoxidans]